MLNKLFIAIILSIASIKTYANNQIDCLAKAMYFESRGGEAHEQLNVGHVILNRVESGKPIVNFLYIQLWKRDSQRKFIQNIRSL